MVHHYSTFMNSEPYSVSAADYAANFKIAQRVIITPLSMMGSPYLGTEPRNKCPDARLLAFLAERWDASEWMFNTMPDA